MSEVAPGSRRKSPPAARITREEVMRAALAIVDADGVAGLSMRRLGQACGVEAMSLYHHVGGKQEVLDGVRDLVIAEVDTYTGKQATAREQLADYARAARAVLLRHPNVLPMLTEPRAVGAPVMRISERVLATLRANGYTAQQAFTAVEVVNAYVLGSVAVTVGMRQRVAPPDWRDDQEPSIPFDAATYPNMAWMYQSLSAAKADPHLLLEVVFIDGLTALLDGLERQFATNSTSKP